MTRSELYIGLMSGTSVDAVDAALTRFDATGAPSLVDACALAPPDDLRRELLHIAQPGARTTLAELGALDQRIGHWFALAANTVMRRAGVTADEIAAIGSHGQTLWHQPDADPAFSVQVGSPSRIAAATACPVVADFRNADMAIGGQGAPLAPGFHDAVFSHPERSRAILNIGGIANVTILPPKRGDANRQVLGFDTGPGNALMDAWISSQHGRTCDRGGTWAAQGNIDRELLARLLTDPFIQRAPPKSTGRDHYSLQWLETCIADSAASPAPADVQATLCRFSAESAADAINTGTPSDSDVILCGGGAHNPVLRTAIAECVAPRPVAISSGYGVTEDWVEAMAFAWLARQRLRCEGGNVPGVTGARAPACLGGLHLPPQQMS